MEGEITLHRRPVGLYYTKGTLCNSPQLKPAAPEAEYVRLGAFGAGYIQDAGCRGFSLSLVWPEDASRGFVIGLRK